LIRHAKSDWGNPLLSDFDRPLNERGEQNAPMMGERLAASGLRPDYMLSSSAKRAKSTAEFIARSLGFPPHNIDLMTELYLASPRSMLDTIRNCPDHVTTLALIGHNPGISELANQLCGDLIGDIPTCGIVHLSANLQGWRKAENNFQLIDFDYPRRNP